MKDKKYHKRRNHCHYTGEYRGAVHGICNLKYSVPEKIPIAFPIYLFRRKHWKMHNLYGSNRKKVTKTDKNGEKTTKKISCGLQFIDSVRFMAGSLSNLVNNLSKGIRKIKCKDRHNDKKCETCGIKYKNLRLFFLNLIVT